MTAIAQLLGLALLLGFDSFRASFGLSSAGLVGARPFKLALAFGICDAGASFLGVVGGRSLPPQLRDMLGSIGPVVLIAAAIYALVGRVAVEAQAGDESWAIVGGVPLTLSLDNLAGGAMLGAYGFPIVVSALVLGVSSGLLSAAGFAFGRIMRRCVTSHMEYAGAAILLLLAISFATERT